MTGQGVKVSERLPARAGRRWAVGRVETGHEIEVTRQIGQARLAQVYCPRCTRFLRPRGSRKAEEKKRALYPGYIFAAADTLGDLEVIYKTPGFMHFLRWMDDEGRLQTIADEEIRIVRVRARRGILLPRSIRTLVPFIAGQRARVVGMDSAFGGYVGTVVSQDKGRVLVAGGDFTIGAELPAELLEEVDDG